MDGLSSNLALASSRIFKQNPDDSSKFLSANSASLTGVSAAPAAQTQQAVVPVEDSVKIDPAAQSVTDLQAIMDKLTSAKDGNSIVDALKGLRDFVNNYTGASFAGGILSELGEIADAVLNEVGDNPDALGETISLSFNVNFAASIKSNENFYKSNIAFSFSFSLETEDTKMQANLAFAESIKSNGNSFKYLSSESASVSITTTNVSLEENAALSGFNDILARIGGASAASILGLGVPPAPPIEEQPENTLLQPVLDNAQKQSTKNLADLLDSFFESISLSDRAIGLLEQLLSNIKARNEGEITEAAAA